MTEEEELIEAYRESHPNCEWCKFYRYVTRGIMYGVPTYEECVLKEKMLHCKWLAVFCKYYRVDEEKIKV